MGAPWTKLASLEIIDTGITVVEHTICCSGVGIVSLYKLYTRLRLKNCHSKFRQRLNEGIEWSQNLLLGSNGIYQVFFLARENVYKDYKIYTSHHYHFKRLSGNLVTRSRVMEIYIKYNCYCTQTEAECYTSAERTKRFSINSECI